MSDNEVKTAVFRCEAGHSVRLKLDGNLAEEVRARREKNRTCEVGVGGGAICGVKLVGEKKPARRSS